MVFLIVFTAAVVAICAVAVWPAAGLVRDAAREGRDGDADGKGRPAPPESLEGVLVAQLISGEISRAQYHRSIEGLAARDDDRHPLSVPPESGPAGAV